MGAGRLLCAAHERAQVLRVRQELDFAPDVARGCDLRARTQGVHLYVNKREGIDCDIELVYGCYRVSKRTHLEL